MNKTKMLNAALASTLCVLLSGGLVSCKDYRDDISHLEKEVDGLKSQINQIDAKIQAGKTIKDVKEADGGVKITLSDGSEYTIAGSKKGENGKSGSVVTIGENGNWFIDGKDTNKPSKGVKGDKGDKGDAGAYYYPGTTGEEKGFWVKKDGEKKEITKDKWLFDGVVTAVYKNGVVTLSNVEGANGDIVFGALEITEVSLDYNPKVNLAYSSTPAVVGRVFAEGVEGAVTFVKGQRLADDGIDVILKVNPVNVDLSKMLESIKLIRIDANTDVNEYVVATKAERATAEDLHPDAVTVTRAMPSQTGLWKVTFGLKPDSDFNKFGKLTTINSQGQTRYYTYAVAIESSAMKAAASEDRFVASEFGLAMSAEKRAAIYNSDLVFYAKSSLKDWQSVAELLNRGNLKDQNGKSQTEYKWANTDKAPLKVVLKEADDCVKDDNDDRSAKKALPVVVNKAFEVAFAKENVADYKKIYAYYITLDKKFVDTAVNNGEDVSEQNAWDSYTYEGLNKIYRANEVAEIKVTSATAAGDVIGFRVHAINWDGTLVDPDGRAFYVTVGKEAADLNAIATEVMPMNETVSGVHSDAVVVDFSKIKDVHKAVTTVEWTTDAPFNKDKGTKAFEAYFYSDEETQNIVFNTTQTELDDLSKLSKAIRVYTVPNTAANLTWLNFEDNKAYSGTLTLKDKNGIAVAEVHLTFTKKLPTTAPEGFSIKTKQLDENGVYNSYLVPDNWAAPDAANGTMILSEVFNFGKGDPAKYSVTFESSKVTSPTDNTVIDLEVKGNETLTVTKDFVNNETKHATKVDYNYGRISTEKAKLGKDYVVEGIAHFPTVFCNIYNSTYSWHWATHEELGHVFDGRAKVWKTSGGQPVEGAGYPTEFQYGDETSAHLVIDFANIFGVSTRDTKYNAKLSEPYGNTEAQHPGKSLKVTGAKVVSKANNTEEYFVINPAFADGNTTLQLVRKTGATNPTADVESLLVIEAKDMYNNDVIIKLPVTVKKR